MKCVAITRILDEVDIVEAFVRHTAAYVQHHIMMDNGSRDGTVEILQKLADEGFSITVYQNSAVSFSEQSFMTFMYQDAVEKHGADWVYCLDCDEFIHDRDLSGGMNAYLRYAFSNPMNQMHVHLEWGNYRPRPSDDVDEILVAKRMVYRNPITSDGSTIDDPTGLKIIINTRIGVKGVVVDDGGHNVLLHGAYPPSIPLVTGACLAHYFERSPFHILRKAARGWAKVLAAGHRVEGRGTSSHYKTMFEILRDRPQDLLRSDYFMGFRYEGNSLIHDPIEYRGGPLRYTSPIDHAMLTVRAVVGYLEDLSRHHGKLVDELPIVRRYVEEQNQSHIQLIGGADLLVQDQEPVPVHEIEPLPVEPPSFNQRIRHTKTYAKMQLKKLRLALRGTRPISSVSHMPGFDEKYYLYWYPDVLQFPGSPLRHYLKHGWKEGRDPSAGFSNDGYLAANPDVEASGLNPLLHFAKHGLVEGREGWQKHPFAAAPETRSVQRVENNRLRRPTSTNP